MSKALIKKIAEIDTLIRTAQWSLAREALSQIKSKDIPTNELVSVAGLATRANLPKLALNLLRPLVYPAKKFIRPANQSETAEYAIALVRLGADSEAAELLAKVSTTEVPRCNSYKAILLMKQWKYAEAVPLLTDYLSKERDGYFHTNGLSNLAQSLFFLKRFRELEPFLSELIKHSNEKGMLIHKANAIRYLGMIAFQEKSWKVALSHLEQATQILAQTDGLDSLFVRKWVALTKAFQSGGDSSSCKEVETVRNEAINRRHWETVRDIDYHKALLFNDEALGLKLYFGTPYASFRNRLVSNFPNLPLNKPFLWELGPAGKRPRKIIDFSAEVNPEGGESLKGGHALYRLSCILLSDFYRPFGVVSLFDKLFPGDHYNGERSRHRVFQVVNRLRTWFETNKMPLQLDSSEGEYLLTATVPLAMAIPQDNANSTVSLFQHRLNTVYEGLGEEFRTVEVIECLGISRTRATVFIERAIEMRVVEKVGASKDTKYRFVPKELKKAA